ncbi:MULTISPECIES: hypothetical protein [unclassified Arthrobacter]|uniref:hypothetical protein n=1 Tax=unclassified Arthrobacter TaxID=235627 RepID=UPI001492A3D0|nr:MULTISPECIES: hypothetical protein [unclassified Arthrobacter]MBE0008360.1 hypothetical protein [Arthrobacter sp. AET 35A]NOJ62099.1 hypothetical protein [Arthrobacter sp. 147(2020)]
MTEPAKKQDNTQGNPQSKEQISAHLSDSAAKKLQDDPRAKLALAKKNPDFGKLDGARSTGPNHQPVHRSGKQGKTEKKARW